MSEIVRMAIELEILERKNSMYYYRGMALAKDLDKTKNRLRRERELATEIEEHIRKECLPPPPMPLET